MGDRQNGCWGSFIDGAAYRGDAFSIAVDVRETSVSDLEFRQTGYVVSIVSPISTPAVLRSSAGSRSISIPAGTSRFCVSEPRYEVELAGCFRTPAGIETVSREHAELSLVPAVFAVEGRIEGEELAGNFFKRFDGGLRIGCGAEYQMIYAEMAYDFGLANICHSDFDTSRTGCFYLNFGVNF